MASTEEFEHALVLSLSWVCAKFTANGAEGVYLEYFPWDLGCGYHAREFVAEAGHVRVGA